MSRSRIIRTNHTILVEVKGKKLARVWRAHPAITAKYDSITSDYFGKPEYRLGDLLVVKVKLSGKRRLVQWVQKDPEVNAISDFDEVYGSKLEVEAKRYARMHGLAEGEVAKESGKEFAPILDERETSTATDYATWDEVIEPSPDPKPEPKPDPIDWSKTIYVSEQDNALLNTIEKISNKHHAAVMMIGPSGYGKTSIPEQKAKDWNMEFLRWDCATVRDPEEFFGFRGAVDGSTMTEEGETFFSESNFTKTVEEGNAVIVLDELNRIDPYISNILFPLLDHAGKTEVAGHEIVVGPNVIFVATVNVGFQFTGTFTLDTALTNRFAAKILVGPLPSEVEEGILKARAEVTTHQAKRIVKLMTSLRRLNEKGQLSIDASTRVSLQLGELMANGLDIKNSVVYTIINGISDEEAKLVVDALGIIMR